jgi:hypothetical protein
MDNDLDPASAIVKLVPIINNILIIYENENDIKTMRAMQSKYVHERGACA